MKNQLIAGMVALTALSTIRTNDGRHVPGTPSADFEADAKTARSLVTSGAARYTDPEQVEPEGNDDTGTDTGTGSGAETGGTLVAPLLAAALTETAAKKAGAATDTTATATKPAAKPAAKTAAKKTAAKK